MEKLFVLENSDSVIKDFLELEPYTMGRFLKEYLCKELDCEMQDLELLDTHPNQLSKNSGITKFFPEDVVKDITLVSQQYELPDDGLDMPLVCYQVGEVWTIDIDKKRFIVLHFQNTGEMYCFHNKKV